MYSTRARQVEFRSGMTLGGNSHRVTIPSFTDETVIEFYDNFKEYTDAATDHELARDITRFVHDEIEYANPAEKYDPHTGEQLGDEVPLEFSIKYGLGRCKEQAGAAQILMQHEGIESRYIKGAFPAYDPEENEWKHGKHAWLKVRTEKGNYIADPTNNHFEPYDDFMENHRDIGCQEINQEIFLEPGQEDALDKLI